MASGFGVIIDGFEVVNQGLNNNFSLISPLATITRGFLTDCDAIWALSDSALTSIWSASDSSISTSWTSADSLITTMWSGSTVGLYDPFC